MGWGAGGEGGGGGGGEDVFGAVREGEGVEEKLGGGVEDKLGARGVVRLGKRHAGQDFGLVRAETSPAFLPSLEHYNFQLQALACA